jgi:Tol biopolymer transport system component
MDASRLVLTGPPAPVVEDVMASTGSEAPSDGSAQYDVASSGMAVYRTGKAETLYRLVLLDRAGTELKTIGPPRSFARPRLSPDGGRVAVVVGGEGAGDIWIYDVARDSFQRLTFEGTNWSPAWTPDGRNIAYTSTRADQRVRNAAGGLEPSRGVFEKRADGSGAERFLFRMKALVACTGFSADGRILAFDAPRPDTQSDVAIARFDASGALVGQPEIVVASTRIESNGAISPDGRWLAYEVGDGGNSHIFLRSMSGGESKWQVSEAIGTTARWTRDGRLHYLREDGAVVALSVTENAGAPVLGKEERLFAVAALEAGSRAFALNGWDVSPDGTRFVALKRETSANSLDLNHAVLVSDFAQELRAQTPKTAR